MASLLFLIPCALIIAAFQSTAEGRREARQRFARHNGPCWIVVALIWAGLLIR